MGDLKKNNYNNAKVTAGNDLSFLFDDDNKNSNTNQDDLNKLKFTTKTTKTITEQESFVSRALSGVITKIDDPLGKKRGTLGR